MMRVSSVLTPRVIVCLFLCLCTITMMFVTRCGMNFESPTMPHPVGMRVLESTSGMEEEVQKRVAEILQVKEGQFERDLAQVNQEVAKLRNQLADARLFHGDSNLNSSKDMDKLREYENFIKGKLVESEIVGGIALNNEYEVFPFTRFTAARLYLVDPGLGKRVVEKPIGYKKKELMEVVEFAIKQMNAGRTESQAKFSPDEFLEGIFKTEPGVGTHYEVYFRNVDKQPSQHYCKVIVWRPFAPLHHIQTKEVSTTSEIINLILPLSGRVEKFRFFMDRFARVCIRIDKRVFLTVVYFGDEGLNDVKVAIGKISKTYRFKNIKLVTLQEPFSRGRGLQIGAQSWTQGDVLMFFCDVDIVFSTDFLERCRLNTVRNRRVYYPIVFSLYNPNVVYSLQDVAIPPDNEQLVISKDTGFWRDFGYGMTCQYRSDFMQIKGFDEQIHGWGLEDVYLYRKYVKSDMMVVRATDPGIFHLWHEKVCDPDTPTDQYRGCIRSKALNEASHAQLGMLAFKEEINKHKAMINPQR